MTNKELKAATFERATKAWQANEKKRLAAEKAKARRLLASAEKDLATCTDAKRRTFLQASINLYKKTLAK